jgi:flagellar basal-body rod protein FlgB
MKVPNHIPVGSQSTSSESDDWVGRALILRGQRQTILASNVANADTPGYIAKDIDFAQAMQDANAKLTTSMNTTASGHMQASSLPAMSTADFVRYATPAQSSLDGNSVDMDRERASFAQNSILYQFAVKLLNDEYEDFRMASSDPLKG